MTNASHDGQKQEKKSKSKFSSGFVWGCLSWPILIILGNLLLFPAFRPDPARALQSEAKTYVGSMSRAQQAYWSEKEAFTFAIEELGIGIQSKTKHYKYQIQLQSKNPAVAVNIATSKSDSYKLRSYAGAVFVVPDPDDEQLQTTLSLLCESEERGDVVLPMFQPVGPENPDPQCPAGYREFEW